MQEHAHCAQKVQEIAHDKKKARRKMKLKAWKGAAHSLHEMNAASDDKGEDSGDSNCVGCHELIPSTNARWRLR